MNARKLRVGLLIAVLLLAASAPSAFAQPSPLVRKINDVRHANGLPALRYSPSLARSSRRFARTLMRRNVFAHGSRIAASSRFRRLGETLALTSGWRTRPSRVVRSWLRSPGHRALILSRQFRYLGAGRSRGRFGNRRKTIWVLHLGSH